MTVFGFEERPRDFFGDPRPRQGRYMILAPRSGPERPRDPANPAGEPPAAPCPGRLALRLRRYRQFRVIRKHGA